MAKRYGNLNGSNADDMKVSNNILLSIDSNNYQQWMRSASVKLISKFARGGQFTEENGVWYEGVKPKRYWRVADANLPPVAANNPVGPQPVPDATDENEDVQSEMSNDQSNASTVSELITVTEDEAEDLNFLHFDALKLYNKEKHELQAMKPAIWADIMSLMSPQSIAKVKECIVYDEKFRNHDVVWLWERIKLVHQSTESGVDEEDCVIVISKMMSMVMYKTETITTYKDRFDAHVRVYKQICIKMRIEAIPERILVAVFIRGLNGSYSDYKKTTSNNAAAKINPYPKLVSVAYEQASNWKTFTPAAVKTDVFVANSKKGDKKGDKKSNNKSDVFKEAKSEEKVIVGKDGKPIVCHNDKCRGNHYNNNCPLLKKIVDEVKSERGEKKSAFMMYTKSLDYSHIFAAGTLLSNMVLIDNQCSAGLVNNEKFLTNIRPCANPVRVTGIGGDIVITHEGDSKRFGVLMLCKSIPCQILSFYDVTTKNDIEWDQPKQTFTVEFDDGFTMKFTATPETKMYIHELETSDDVSDDDDIDNNNENALVTVSENESKYTVREVKQAKLAVELQKKMGYASTQDIVEMINSGSIINLPITVRDVKIAEEIYGKSIAIMKGKTRHTSPPVFNNNIVPRPLLKDQKMYSDIMFVNGHAFLVSVILPISLVIANSIAGKTAAILFNSFMKQISAIKGESFNVTDIYIDGEGAMAKLAEKFNLIGIKLHPYAIKVAVVERKIQTIKSRVRSVVLSLPFPLCKILLVCCVLFCISRINMSPCSNRNDRRSPYEDIKGRKIQFDRDLRYSFGDYCEVPVKNTDNDINHQRTESCIAVMSTGSINGGWLFYKPFTGGFTTQTNAIGPLPLSTAMETRLKETYKNDGTNLPLDPTFEIGIKKAVVNDVIEVETVFPLDEEIIRETIPSSTDTEDSDLLKPNVVTITDVPNYNQIEVISENVEVGGIDDNINDNIHDLLTVDEIRGEDVDDSTNNEIFDQSFSDSTDNNNISSSNSSDRNSSDSNSSNDNIANPDSPSYGIHNIPSTVQPRESAATRSSYDFRPRKELTWKKYGYLSSHFTKKQAIHDFGELAVKAHVKEMMQMSDLDVMYPVDWKLLNRDKKRKIIRSHTIFQPKYDADTGEFIKLKARFVANGSTQDRSVYDDVSSPTVSTHAVFLNAAIAAKERRIVKTIDLPGAYLNVKMSGVEVLMHLDSDSAGILILIKPEYEKFQREFDGSMIVRLDRALYGCIESAKLWYEEISSTLQADGYVANIKDICVFNKVVDGVQCTITLHVDDLMITCVNEVLIDCIISVLKSKYDRPGAEIPVTSGSIHNYLGMTFDFSVVGEVKITMNGYIDELMKFTNTEGTAKTPATTNLYTISESIVLNLLESEYFHSVVAKLLYLAKRARPDLLTSVGFLAKRVQCSTKFDMIKLERVLKYLNSTRSLGLTLRPKSDLTIYAYVDASYAVHNDMKSQSGMAITLGDGVSLSKSNTQQLNSKSSTEAELIALSDSSGHIIWVRDYLIEQGYKLGTAVVYQDNMSTMASAKKRYSTSDKTRHINIRYFFIQDRVELLGFGIIRPLILSRNLVEFITKK